MARIPLLDSTGKNILDAANKPKYLHSVDGRHAVARGELMEVRKVQQIGDKQKSVLVAYRPVSEGDKKAKLDSARAKLVAAQAEVDAAEKTGKSDTDKPADKPVNIAGKSKPESIEVVDKPEAKNVGADPKEDEREESIEDWDLVEEKSDLVVKDIPEPEKKEEPAKRIRPPRTTGKK